MPARELLRFVWALAVGSAFACGYAEERASPACGEPTGIASKVLDGDTVDLRSGVRIRYLLVDAPEIAHSARQIPECYGNEATTLNTQLVLGREVTLEYDQQCKDRYDRLLAYVYIGDRMVNREIIARGFARLLVIPPNEKHAEELERLEADAREEGRGLWGDCQ